VAKQVVAKRTVDEWRRELAGKPFIGLYGQPPFSLQARQWLDRHHRMVVWNKAVITNTAPGFRAFLGQYPDSDLTATARKLEERLRNRPSTTQAVAATVSSTPGELITPAGSGAALQAVAAPASQPAPCQCSEKSKPLPKNRTEANRPKRAERATPARAQNASYGSSNGYGAGYGRSGY
jgi:hypothetical protein